MAAKLAQLETGRFRRWNIIPNATTIALYSFRSQAIELSDIDSATYQAAIDGKLGPSQRVVPLLAHETRHYIDHVGSVWGQHLLRAEYDALNARALGVESELWRIVRYCRLLRDNRFERYYTTVNENMKSGPRPWSYQLSAGARYDNVGHLDKSHPILFTRFSWSDGTFACRVPLSTISLLETTAQEFELRVRAAFLTQLSESNRGEAFARLQRELLDTMYTPGLAEYSVAVHAAANTLGFKDVPAALNAAALIASVALNLPSVLFHSLRIPEAFSKWGETNQHFLQRCDRGFAYLALLHNAPAFDPDVGTWVESVLRESSLPDLVTLRQLAEDEMASLQVPSVTGPYNELAASRLAVRV